MTKMTAAQAIDILKNTRYTRDGLPLTFAAQQAFDMAIAALKPEPIEGLQDAGDVLCEILNNAGVLASAAKQAMEDGDFIAPVMPVACSDIEKLFPVYTAIVCYLEISEGTTPASNSQLP